MNLGLSCRYQILVQIFCPRFKTSKCFIGLQDLPNTSQLLFSQSDTSLQSTLGFFFVVVIIIFLFTVYSNSGKHLVYQNALVLIAPDLVWLLFREVVFLFIVLEWISVLLIQINLLLAYWTHVLWVKPLGYAVLMESMKTHEHQVLFTDFIIALTNRAKLVFFRKVLFICNCKFVNR